MTSQNQDVGEVKPPILDRDVIIKSQAEILTETFANIMVAKCAFQLARAILEKAFPGDEKYALLETVVDTDRITFTTREIFNNMLEITGTTLEQEAVAMYVGEIGDQIIDQVILPLSNKPISSAVLFHEFLHRSQYLLSKKEHRISFSSQLFHALHFNARERAEYQKSRPEDYESRLAFVSHARSCFLDAATENATIGFSEYGFGADSSIINYAGEPYNYPDPNAAFAQCVYPYLERRGVIAFEANNFVLKLAVTGDLELFAAIDQQAKEKGIEIDPEDSLLKLIEDITVISLLKHFRDEGKYSLEVAKKVFGCITS